MARMFPPDLTGTTPTPAQERVYAFLDGTLDDDHWIWFHPVLKRERRSVTPDFVLLGPAYGLVALVVCDWHRGKVSPAGAEYVRIATDDETPRTERRPELGAGLAAKILDERLGADARLDATRAGWAVLYANFRRDDLAAARERGLLPDEPHALSGTDLAKRDPETRGKLLTALTKLGGQAPALTDTVRDQIRAAIQPQIQFFDLRLEVADVSDREDSHARTGEMVSGSAPESGGRVPLAGSSAAGSEPMERTGGIARSAFDPAGGTLPPDSGAGPDTIPPSGRRTLLTDGPIGFFLDRKQERMARELASPRTLVYGPAGSGKTVFLIARARYWLDLQPDSRVLLTCYNSSLASHIRRQFAARGLDPDGERLTVLHYHDLCARLLGMGPEFHTQSEVFYDTLEPKVFQRLAADDAFAPYDLILVDEGQDFSRRMFELLVRLNGEGGELTVVCDPAQDIYLRWETENLAPLGDYAVEHLVDCYRNTAPIFGLARGVMDPATRRAMGLDRLEMTRPEDLGREGPVPALEPLDGLDDLVERILAMVADARERGLGLSETAVLYTDRHAIPDFGRKLRRSSWEAKDDPRFRVEDEDEDDDSPTRVAGTLTAGTAAVPAVDRVHFAEALERELNRRGVPAEWVARDFFTRAGYDIAKERLTLCTIHSAKGMDFHGVVLLGAETLPVDDATGAARSSALLFTGITRARERLWLPHFADTGWVGRLRDEIGHLE